MAKYIKKKRRKTYIHPNFYPILSFLSAKVVPNEKYCQLGYSTVYFLIFTAHFSASPYLDVKSQYEMSAENTICKSMKKNHVCKYTEN